MHTNASKPARIRTSLLCAAMVSAGCHGGELRGVFEARQTCSDAECGGRSAAGAAGVRSAPRQQSPIATSAGRAAEADSGGNAGSVAQAAGHSGGGGRAGDAGGVARAGTPAVVDDADGGVVAADGGLPVPGPHVFHVAPRIVYAGEPRAVRLIGTGLRAEHEVEVLVDGARVGVLEVVSAVEARILLPALAPGRHLLELGAQAPPSVGLELVSLERHNYAEVELRLPEQLEPAVFDPLRRAFFMLAPNASVPKLYRLQLDAAEWKISQAQIPAAYAVTQLPASGELLVATGTCAIARVDPDTLAVVDTSAPATGCTNNNTDSYMQACAFADGHVLLASPYSAALFPGFFPVTAPLSPRLSVLSPDRTRMLWAANGVYSYDLVSRTFEPVRLLGTSSGSGNVIDLSEDGRRLIHGESIYDRANRFLGTLDLAQPPTVVALSGNAEIAVAEVRGGGIQAFDVRAAAGPFPALGQAIALPFESYGLPYRLVVDDAGQTAFVFLSLSRSADDREYRMLVRRLPAK